jgi:predicted AAA+ superfamily ATPase
MNVVRLNQDVFVASIERMAVTAILGPRRVGKSYFINQYAEKNPDKHFLLFNMDELSQRQAVRQKGLRTLIIEKAKYHIGDGEKLWVVIDEAQKCPEIFDQIKLLYDAFKDANVLKIIITGSSMLSLHQLSTESLAGRIELYHLYEFNLREMSMFHDANIPNTSIFDELFHLSDDVSSIDRVIHQLMPFRPLLEDALSQTLVWGGFPELLNKSNSDEKIIYLNNYLQTYLEKDVRAIDTISDIERYRQLMEILAEQTGSVRDDKRIVDALRCSRDTVKKYQGFLSATLLFSEIYPYIGSTLKRLTKTPKGYLLNNGLVSLLTGIFELNLLQKTGLIGHRLENWFLNELNTWLTRTPMRCSIHYWRTSTGVEVDFVVVKKPTIYPFEVTYSSTIDRKKLKNLKAFLADEPKASWGFYIYQGDFLVDTDAKIIFIPCFSVG